MKTKQQELRVRLQNRKNDLRKRRYSENFIKNDPVVVRLQKQLKELIKIEGNVKMSPLLEAALSQFIENNQGTDKLDKVLKKHLIDIALVQSYGNQSKAARMLGIDRGSLRMFINENN